MQTSPTSSNANTRAGRTIPPPLRSAIERLASALLHAGAAPPTDEGAASATRRAIHTAVRAMLAPDPSPFPDDLPSSVRCATDELASIAKQIAERDDPAEIYQRLLACTPHLDADAGVITFSRAGENDRRSRGSFYTPTALVDHLLSMTLDRVIEQRLEPLASAPDTPAVRQQRRRAILSIRVCDPACGSGRFLLAAGDRLTQEIIRTCLPSDPSPAQRDEARRDVFSSCLFGVDLDPVAVELCRHSLGSALDDTSPLERHIRRGDALLWAPPGHKARPLLDTLPEHAAPFCWDREFPEVLSPAASVPPGFDVVVGNPPFLNQLQRATATDRSLAPLLRAISDGVIHTYADPAAAFLLLAKRLTAPGGRTAMVMPLSFLAARDAKPARDHLLKGARLESLWVSGERVFPDASVLTCAPTLLITPERQGDLRRCAGASFIDLAPLRVCADELMRASTWSHLGAAALGVPEVDLPEDSVLGELCEATADFRDQYYGLDGFLLEHDDLSPTQQHDITAYPPIVTAGLIDLAQCDWGARACRLLKSRWRAPRIDRPAMRRSGALDPWISSRLVPKLIVATQTRVIEVFADHDGRHVPSVPLISVIPKEQDQLWRLAAALASPALTALAHSRYMGAALHADAIKLSAKQVLALPLPTNRPAWDRAASHFKAASFTSDPDQRVRHLRLFAEAACEAHLPCPTQRQAVLAWWLSRLAIDARSDRDAVSREAAPAAPIAATATASSESG